VSELTTISKPAGRHGVAELSVFSRSRIGNGKALLRGIDTHSAEYREFKTIVVDLVSHMGTDPSVVERALAEEAASLIYWCRRARLLLLTGGEFKIQEYTTASNSLRRILADIGQAPRLKNVTQSLTEYLAELPADDAHQADELDDVGEPDEEIEP
jgi:hypothetical protein